MWNKQRYCRQLQNHVWIQNFRRSKRKASILWDFRISSWSYDMKGHAKKCVERYCELANKTTQQLYKVSTPCLPSLQRRRIEIRGRMVKSMLSSCSEMLILGTYWKSRCFMVSEQTCTNDHKMDSLARLISCIRHTCAYRRYCYVGIIAQQCRSGLFQDSDFCRRSWGFKIYIRWNIVYFRKSYICSNQLDV